MKHAGWLFGAVLLVQQAAPARLAVPVEPVTAIVDALRSHDVVAMGAGQTGSRLDQQSGPNRRVQTVFINSQFQVGGVGRQAGEAGYARSDGGHHQIANIMAFFPV
jgi:hypothetical protein